MTKSAEKGLDSVEEVICFYNQYFGHEKENQDILELIKDLSLCFYQKQRRFKEEDFSSLGVYAKEWGDFFLGGYFDIDQNTQVETDAYGTIKGFHQMVDVDTKGILGVNEKGAVISFDYDLTQMYSGFIGENVVELFNRLPHSKQVMQAKSFYQYFILKNVFVSKLYWAVKEVLLRSSGQVMAEKFTQAHPDILGYEAEIKHQIALTKQRKDDNSKATSLH